MTQLERASGRVIRGSAVRIWLDVPSGSVTRPIRRRREHLPAGVPALIRRRWRTHTKVRAMPKDDAPTAIRMRSADSGWDSSSYSDLSTARLWIVKKPRLCRGRLGTGSGPL